MSTHHLSVTTLACEARSRQLYQEQHAASCARIDRLFVVLLILQWFAAIAAAIWISPLTWSGALSRIHPHLWAAIFLGGATCLLPVGLALVSPGTRLTRHMVAIGQMLFSALLIHLTGGRIETHFHVFGSLAFLSFYRERSVLLTATAIITVDHFLRGNLWPASVFGSLGVSPWRWVEHAAWVVFEDVFLLISIARTRKVLQKSCNHQAKLETSHEIVEAQVIERTAWLHASEARLRQSEERLRLMVEQAIDAIVAIDKDGTIQTWNPSAAAMFGIPEQEVLNLHITNPILPEVLRSAYQERMRELGTAESGTAACRHTERVAHDRSGREFQVELVMFPVHLGSQTLFSAFLRNITERKQMEQALIAAREAALAGSRLKSDFLANMSHEIRTPMNGVLGMIDLLADTQLSIEQRDYVETVRNSAEALLTIINDILDVSKIEAGMLTIEPLPFDLQQGIEEVSDLLAVKAGQKGIDLVVRYAPGAPRWLVGDIGRIRQIVTNLASNAIKFTESGHVLIEVSSPLVEAGRACMEITVSDSGIGIPEDKLDHIFGKFTQADTSTTRRYGGTGLGLAIAKQLAELMGGALDVTSRVGQGSTFRLRLGLPRTEPQLQPPVPVVDLTGCHALIVDDSAVNRRVLQEQLHSFGGRATAVSSGPAALLALRQAQAQGCPFGLVVVDYQMPEMDGLMLARHIREDKTLRDTVLVMLSSMGQAESQRLRELDIAACLVKPPRLAHLRSTLGSAWARAQVGRAQREAYAAQERAATVQRPSAEIPRLGLHVLVAEDNLINQKVATKLLQRLGCKVDIAENGQAAVDLALQRPYDLIFMDCQMPEMDGEQATAELRRLRPYSCAPIVAMTAHAMQGDRERCLAAGMDDYVSKPINLEALISVLQRWARDLSFKNPLPALIPQPLAG